MEVSDLRFRDNCVRHKYDLFGAFVMPYRQKTTKQQPAQQTEACALQLSFQWFSIIYSRRVYSHVSGFCECVCVWCHTISAVRTKCALGNSEHRANNV